MPPSLDILKQKLAGILTAIALRVDSKLDKNAASVSAARLTSPFTLSLTADALGSASIHGGANVSIAVTLPNIASAGTYPKVTINAKGQVVGGELLIAGDIPALDAGKIATGAFDPARIPSLDASKVGSGVFNAARIPLPARLATARSISLTGDGSWTVNFDGNANATAAFTLSVSGVAAGTYGSATQIPQMTVDAKGRITGVTLIDIKAQTAIAVNEYVTVAVDGVKQYDLQTLLGAGHAAFDKKTAEISVRAKDTNGSSPLLNAYANAEALISYGIKDERYVIISNQSGGAIDLYVKVLVHPL
jgi:phage-related tail fiber protein